MMGILDSPVTANSLAAAIYKPRLPFLALNPNADAPAVAKPAPPRQGLLARIGNALTADRLQAIGAGLHDLGSGTNTLDSVLEQLRQAQAQRQAQLWQSTVQQRQMADWKTQDQQNAAADAAAAQAPEAVRPYALANPSAYTIEAMRNAMLPQWQRLTPEQARAEGYQAGTVVQRNPTTGQEDVTQAPRQPSAYQQQADAFSPEDVDFYAQAGLRQGGLPRYISVRSPLVPRILRRMREMAVAQNIPPERLASISAAYGGDTHAYTKLNETYNNVVAFERTTDSFLSNLQTLASRVPRNQISDSGFMNQAIQNYNHGVRQDPALSAYIGALVSTRMELARTLGGSVSPPVESMHDAEAILPNDVGYRALMDRNGVATNIHNEMQLRGQSLRGTLDDIQSRIESGEIPNMRLGATPPPPPASSTPAPPPGFVVNR